MPELPEVETIRRHLAPVVEGRTLAELEVRDPRWCRPLEPAALTAALSGRRIERLHRRGKYLIWILEGEVHLLVHLRMTGTLLVDPTASVTATATPTPTPTATPTANSTPTSIPTATATATPAPTRATALDPPHTRVVFQLDGPTGAGDRRRVVFVDPRRFGTGELVVGAAAAAEFLARRLGVEPFDAAFAPASLRALAHGRRSPIKAFLLDQRRIAGVGNIYADEALHRAGIHPQRPAGRLTAAQWRRLCLSVQEALSDGIDAGGATIDDFRDIDGARGTFQDRFRVHRRAGEACATCGTLIFKMVVAGRGTYVCATCQPPPRSAPAARMDAESVRAIG